MYLTNAVWLCREFRALVIEMVLATDMSFHFQQLKNMKNLLGMPEKSVSHKAWLIFHLSPYLCCSLSVSTTPVLQHWQAEGPVAGAALCRHQSPRQGLEPPPPLDQPSARGVLQAGWPGAGAGPPYLPALWPWENAGRRVPNRSANTQCLYTVGSKNNEWSVEIERVWKQGKDQWRG